jgi:hypothetical protein
MQTKQRRIPVPGGAGGKPAYYLWTQMLPVYEGELADFRARVEAARTGKNEETRRVALTSAPFRLIGSGAIPYSLQAGASVFSDKPSQIRSLAPEVQGLTAIRAAAGVGAQTIEFETDQPVVVLLGYFESPSAEWRQPPDLDTNASAAGSVSGEVFLQHALDVPGLPPVNIHAWRMGSGRHRVDPPGSGNFAILGIVPQSALRGAVEP